MTVSWHEPIQTRNGMKVEIQKMDLKDKGGVLAAYPVLAIVTDSDGSELVVCYTLQGKFAARDESEHDLDIINVPKKREMWMNVYPIRYENQQPEVYFHPTKEDADRTAGNDRVACIRIEYAEGEGL